MLETIHKIDSYINEAKALGRPGCHLEFDFQHGDLDAIKEYYEDKDYLMILTEEVHSQDIDDLCHVSGSIAWGEEAKASMTPIEGT